MVNKDLVIGIDASTTAVKAIAFSREGEALAECRGTYPLSTPHPGHYEQDPQDWWTALTAALRELTSQIDVNRFAGLAVTHQRETFALLGESGCGKSATAQGIMRLLPANGQISAGSSIQFAAEELLTLSEADMRTVRGKRMAMIFQEPGTSLNPSKREPPSIAGAHGHDHRRFPCEPGNPTNATRA